MNIFSTFSLERSTEAQHDRISSILVPNNVIVKCMHNVHLCECVHECVCIVKLANEILTQCRMMTCGR